MYEAKLKHVGNEQLAILYRSGMTMQGIAALYDCSYQAVRNRLKASGVRIRTPYESLKLNKKNFGE